MSDSYLHGVEVVEVLDGGQAITTQATAVIGIVGTAPFADPAAFPLDTPVLVTSPRTAAALTATLAEDAELDAEGTLPVALQGVFDQVRTSVVVIRVDTEETETAQLATVVGQAAQLTGVYALLAAKSVVGLKPKILIAPGFTHQTPTAGEPAVAAANPVVMALRGVADRLRAVVVADGPSDTDAAALAKVGLEGGERVYHVDPTVGVLDRTGAYVQRPASAHVAGLGAKSDQTRGFWWSWSNQTLNGVVSIGRPIEFSTSDATASSNILNAAGVAVIVNDDGFRLWGNRTAPNDGQYEFLPQRRCTDVVFDAVEASFRWAQDRPFSANLLDDIASEVALYQRNLKARGAQLGGRVWLDPELNTEATFKAGQLYVNFDGEAPAPLDRLTFLFNRNTGYYAELVSAAGSSQAA